MKISRIISIGTVALVAAGTTGAVQASTISPITLEDENSEAIFDIDSSTGMSAWKVDGVDHMSQQSFWFRTGDDTQERNIADLSIDGYKATDTDLDAGDDSLSVKYAGDGFNIVISYDLEGGTPGSGSSDIAELIDINNTTESEFSISFFQYSDFDLNNTPDDDTAELANPNTVRQGDAAGVLSETVETPAGDRHEIGLFDDTRTKLNDKDEDNLNNNSGPETGNVTWAFQWDFTLSPQGKDGSTQQISKDKNFRTVPAPATLALLGMGLVGLGAVARRRCHGA